MIDGLFEAKTIEKHIGDAEIKKVFTISNNSIAGCYLEQGKALSSSNVKVLRENELISETTIKSLRREKNEVKEVVAGQECGIQLENFNEIQEGDKLSFFIMEKDE